MYIFVPVEIVKMFQYAISWNLGIDCELETQYQGAKLIQGVAVVKRVLM